MGKTRKEIDSMGEIEVPEDKYWGAQTQRSLKYFSIGQDNMPIEVIHALAVIKKAAATANQKLGRLSQEKTKLIVKAADEIIEGRLDEHFPLRVWMTGSGTQANMNVNEVIANRAIELAGGRLGSKKQVHPNDDVNMSQSSNDVFPAAMHIAAAKETTGRLIPAAEKLRLSFASKSKSWKDIVKIGRTHMQDAVPMTLGQEFSGYGKMLEEDIARIEYSLNDIYGLALGGTAIGTGLNAPKGFDKRITKEISKQTGLPFTTAANKFAVQGAHNALVMLQAAIKTLAVSLYKISNDIILLGCGPRCGIGELTLPANEPGSSIMPGKVNPTQCEAVAMIAVQVMGYDAAVSFAGAGGSLEMNVYKPLIIFNIIQSIKLRSDGCLNLSKYTVDGIEPNLKKIDEHVKSSLMLVTALNPIIGYDKAAEIAKYAFDNGFTLKESAIKLGYISEEEFDNIVNPHAMAHPHQ